jgi:hypothetical protein
MTVNTKKLLRALTHSHGKFGGLSLYVIPREGVRPVSRIKEVKLKDRAAYGPELQIIDFLSFRQPRTL